MKRRTFTIEFKRSIVQKILSQGVDKKAQISQEYRICIPTLQKWIREFATIGSMKNIESRPQDRDPEIKFSLVIDYFNTAEDKRGEFIRHNGVHTDHIEQWSKDMKDGLKNAGHKWSKQSSIDAQLNQKKMKELEKELIRKEKALAETAALLVLKKKVQQIWEIPD